MNSAAFRNGSRPAAAVAIVTGAAKPDSIGFAVAQGLIEEGCEVVVADLYTEGFAAFGGLCIRTDVADPASVEQMVRQAIEAHGRLDILVNCVGGSWAITEQDLRSPPRRGFLGLTNCELADWRTILGANLDSAFYCCRAAAPHLKKQGGAIVNVSSVAARKGIPPGAEGSSGPYAVAKAGIMALTRQLALELGEYGVRVNCVAPGVIASGRLRKVLALAGEDRGPEGPLSSIPMGRVGSVAETAALIVALCTADTAYMTGAVVDINGASYLA
jgi:NAD(P)-dependent dehydrogenase (short-subunit alcohol dehydrogenase family)